MLELCKVVGGSHMILAKPIITAMDEMDMDVPYRIKSYLAIKIIVNTMEHISTFGSAPRVLELSNIISESLNTAMNNSRMIITADHVVEVSKHTLYISMVLLPYVDEYKEYDIRDIWEFCYVCLVEGDEHVVYI